jgi:hypothetical protein
MSVSASTLVRWVDHLRLVSVEPPTLHQLEEAHAVCKSLLAALTKEYDSVSRRVSELATGEEGDGSSDDEDEEGLMTDGEGAGGREQEELRRRAIHEDKSEKYSRPIFLHLCELKAVQKVIIPTLLNHGLANRAHIGIPYLRLLAAVTLPPIYGSQAVAQQRECLRQCRNAIACDPVFNFVVELVAPVASKRALQSAVLSHHDTMVVDSVLALISNLLKDEAKAVEGLIGVLCRAHTMDLLLLLLHQNDAIRNDIAVQTEKLYNSRQAKKHRDEVDDQAAYNEQQRVLTSSPRKPPSILRTPPAASDSNQREVSAAHRSPGRRSDSIGSSQMGVVATPQPLTPKQRSQDAHYRFEQIPALGEAESSRSTLREAELDRLVKGSRLSGDAIFAAEDSALEVSELEIEPNDSTALAVVDTAADAREGTTADPQSTPKKQSLVPSRSTVPTTPPPAGGRATPPPQTERLSKPRPPPSPSVRDPFHPHRSIPRSPGGAKANSEPGFLDLLEHRGDMTQSGQDTLEGGSTQVDSVLLVPPGQSPVPRKAHHPPQSNRPSQQRRTPESARQAQVDAEEVAVEEVEERSVVSESESDPEEEVAEIEYEEDEEENWKTRALQLAAETNTKAAEDLELIHRWNWLLLECLTLVFRSLTTDQLALLTDVSEAGVEQAMSQKAKRAFEIALEEEARARKAAKLLGGPTSSGALLIKRPQTVSLMASAPAHVEDPGFGAGLPGTDHLLAPTTGSGSASTFTPNTAHLARASVALGTTANATPLQSAVALDEKKKSRFSKKLLSRPLALSTMPLSTQRALAQLYKTFLNAGFSSLSDMTWQELRKKVLETKETVLAAVGGNAKHRADAQMDQGPMLADFADTQLGDVMNYLTLASKMLFFTRHVLRAFLTKRVQFRQRAERIKREQQERRRLRFETAGLPIPDDLNSVIPTESLLRGDLDDSTGFAQLLSEDPKDAEENASLAADVEAERKLVAALSTHWHGVVSLMTLEHFLAGFSLLSSILHNRELRKQYDVSTVAGYLTELLLLLVHMAKGDITNDVNVTNAANAVILSILGRPEHLKDVLGLLGASIPTGSFHHVVEAGVRLAHAYSAILEQVSFNGQVSVGGGGVMQTAEFYWQLGNPRHTQALRFALRDWRTNNTETNTALGELMLQMREKHAHLCFFNIHFFVLFSDLLFAKEHSTEEMGPLYRAADTIVLDFFCPKEVAGSIDLNDLRESIAMRCVRSLFPLSTYDFVSLETARGNGNLLGLGTVPEPEMTTGGIDGAENGEPSGTRKKPRRRRGKRGEQDDVENPENGFDEEAFTQALNELEPPMSHDDGNRSHSAEVADEQALQDPVEEAAAREERRAKKERKRLKKEAKKRKREAGGQLAEEPDGLGDLGANEDQRKSRPLASKEEKRLRKLKRKREREEGEPATEEGAWEIDPVMQDDAPVAEFTSAIDLSDFLGEE